MGKWQERRAVPEERLRRSFGVLVVLGAVLVVGGVVGLLYTAVATLTGLLLFGWLLLVGGLVGLAHAVQSRGGRFFWLGAAVAAVNIAAGVVIIVRNPTGPAVGLGMFAALLFLTAGMYRVVGGLAVRGPQLGWTVFLGVLDLLLGVLVLGDWPSSSLYTLGTFFSLALLFDGLALISTGIGARRVIGMVGEERGRQAAARKSAPGPGVQGRADPHPGV